MRIDAFRPANEFKKDMDDWIGGFRSCKPMPGEERVLVPGDPEREMEMIRKKEGIPLSPSVLQELKELSSKLGVNF